jgi:hypothetical protein
MSVQQPHVETRSDLLRWLRAQRFTTSHYSPQGTQDYVVMHGHHIPLRVPSTHAVLRRAGFMVVVTLPGFSNHDRTPTFGSVILADSLRAKTMQAKTRAKILTMSFELETPLAIALETAEALEFIATVLDALPN